MIDDRISVSEETFEKDMKGDILSLDMEGLRVDYRYIGLWYARDKSEETAITTKLYYGAGPGRPEKCGEEITENSFKQMKRFNIPRTDKNVWIAAKVSDGEYCGLKLFDFQKENFYVNYRIIKNRSHGFDVLKSGIIHCGPAVFAKLGIEDKAGKIDYDDTIMYVVCINDYPPPDWKVDDDSIGIQRLPLLVSSANFSVDDKYSTWNEIHPLAEVK